MMSHKKQTNTQHEKYDVKPPHLSHQICDSRASLADWLFDRLHKAKAAGQVQLLISNSAAMTYSSTDTVVVLE
jgi:NAD dependent epimerase/dehydratase family enzyme